MHRAATPLRYLVVAAFCLAMHNAIMISADWAGFTLLEAAATSFCIMVVVGYMLLSGFVFPAQRTWRGFLRYTGAMAANFPLVTGLTWLFAGLAGQPMAIAAPAATVLMVLFNFVASRWAIAGRGAQRTLGE
jgi:putative flippase GtrA